MNKRARLINTSNYLVLLRCVALLASLANVSVLANPKMKISIYKFLLVMSLADALYSSSLLVITPFSRLCGSVADDLSAPFCYTYLGAYLFLSEYATSCLALFNIFMEIFITTQRICIISGNQAVSAWVKNIRYKVVCLVFFALAFSLYAPVLFMDRIETTRTTSMFNATSNVSVSGVEYKLVKTAFGRSDPALVFMNIVPGLRIALVSFVLFVLNIVGIVRFRTYLTKKKSLKHVNAGSEEKNQKTKRKQRKESSKEAMENKKVTIMLIAIASLYIVGNLPHSIYYMVKITFDIRLSYLSWFSQISLNMLIILKGFIYYLFNDSFRSLLNHRFSRLFCWLCCKRIKSKYTQTDSVDLSSSARMNSSHTTGSTRTKEKKNPKNDSCQ